MAPIKMSEQLKAKATLLPKEKYELEKIRCMRGFSRLARLREVKEEILGLCR
jgi:hypothetical protein